MAARRVVLVDGMRIPFQLSSTVYKNEVRYRPALKKTPESGWIKTPAPSSQGYNIHFLPRC